MEIVGMKKTTFAILAICSAALFLRCNRDTSNNPVSSTDNSSQRLLLKGRIASVGLMKSGTSHSSLLSNSAAVRKVLVYRDFGDADLSPVDSNGNFLVKVERKPCGLIFLDESNKVVGYLSLSSGIEALPLMMVDSAVAQIDMKEINIQGGIGTPQHNPIGAGGESEMTAEELAAYKLQSALFSVIIRNLDMNNDGVIDVLSDRPYWLMFGADFDAGIAATSDPGDSGTMPLLNVFHFNFSDYNKAIGIPDADLMTPDAMHFVRPDFGLFTFPGTGTTATMYHWVLQNTAWGSFVPGSYVITYDADKQIRFDINSPLNADNYIVAAHLWYETAGTKITKVHWKWKMLNGSAIDATKLLQKDVGIGFDYNMSDLIPRPSKNYHVTPADVECAVDVDTASLHGIGLSCNDLFGNLQMTNYKK